PGCGSHGGSSRGSSSKYGPGKGSHAYGELGDGSSNKDRGASGGRGSPGRTSGSAVAPGIAAGGAEPRRRAWAYPQEAWMIPPRTADTTRTLYLAAMDRLPRLELQMADCRLQIYLPFAVFRVVTKMAINWSASSMRGATSLLSIIPVSVVISIQ